jgi:hypothetical protein
VGFSVWFGSTLLKAPGTPIFSSQPYSTEIRAKR